MNAGLCCSRPQYLSALDVACFDTTLHVFIVRSSAAGMQDLGGRNFALYTTGISRFGRQERHDLEFIMRPATVRMPDIKQLELKKTRPLLQGDRNKFPIFLYKPGRLGQRMCLGYNCILIDQRMLFSMGL